MGEIYSKICAKCEKTAIRSRDKIPYTTIGGVHDDKAKTDITWWTNGFWSALMWEMYNAEKNEEYLITARRAQQLLDKAFVKYDGLHHDVGFMWYLSCGKDFAFTGSEEAKVRTLYAANLLAGRFNLRGGFIRAWNEDKVTWSIIDCMMNIPLLYWASEQIKDDRYAQIAMAHADMTMRDHVRGDGSVHHIVVHAPDGSVLETPPGQGYGENSSWSRGQAWAICGFAQSYTWTKKTEYLDTAKRVAAYFLANVPEGSVPLSDFRAPAGSELYDTTAGSIAACGMIEIARHVPKEEKKIYIDGAIRLIKTTDALCGDWNLETDSMILKGSESFHTSKGHMNIIYGDYYFTKAVLLLREDGIDL
ncbi:MAG: glycoside hydrolase family 88 protein [Clostridia bacterium]|nr:glycoside hydrolase family 88 protein [Clostridia bacterium]